MGLPAIEKVPKVLEEWRITKEKGAVLTIGTVVFHDFFNIGINFALC